ncbi:hypothetical protein HK405_010526, partial [Cladochytrium tenue]
RVPHTHSYNPLSNVATAHPLPILATTYDAVYPLSSAWSARAAWVGCEIVEVGGYGCCFVAVRQAGEESVQLSVRGQTAAA